MYRPGLLTGAVGLPKAPRNLIHYNTLDRGGHFAASEQPDIFSTEIRAAFRSLR